MPWSKSFREAAMMEYGSCVNRADSTPYLRHCEACTCVPCWQE